MKREHSRLIEELSAAYAERFPRSAALNGRATRVMVDGGSHTVRLNAPFPVRIVGSGGAHLRDVDGHDLVDFWQGHYANILGHNPAIVTDGLAEAFATGHGLQLGMTDELQVEMAELLCERVHAEAVRFTTSGSLATMYAIMLARAFTGRDLVLKVAGGWHGSQPWALHSVHYLPGSEPWGLESEGLPGRVADELAITYFNEPDDLAEQFLRRGDRIACLVMEPFAGAGTFMAATPEYLTAARELTARHGALLIFDEVISGFRFCAGDLGSLYGVRPDLVTLGKIIGGGMPVAAVAGRRDVMALSGREGGSRVGFSGGTYAAHPASLLAGQDDGLLPRRARGRDLSVARGAGGSRAPRHHRGVRSGGRRGPLHRAAQRGHAGELAQRGPLPLQRGDRRRSAAPGARPAAVRHGPEGACPPARAAARGRVLPLRLLRGRHGAHRGRHRPSRRRLPCGRPSHQALSGGSMIIHMSIHTPKPGKERELIASMHRFGAAGQGQPGFIEALTLRDARSGASCRDGALGERGGMARRR